MTERLHVEAAIEDAATLPSAFYKSPEWYERSREGVFARSWQFVGDLTGLRAPGTTLPFTLLEGCLDEPLLFTRDFEDRLHLLSNVCTHRGMLVCEAGGVERFLRCRYHGRRFGLDGRFQAMPEFAEARDFPRPADSLPRVPFGVYGDTFLMASLNPQVGLEEVLRPVTERVGWLPLAQARLDPTRARDYLVRANWALYVDNYLEGFHIPFIHAGLNAALDYENYSSELFDWCNLQLAPASGAEQVFTLPRTSPDFGQRIAAYYYWIFPNTMLNFYPWGVSVNVVRPLGPDLTKVSFIPYVWDASKLDQGAGAGLDRVEREDEVIVEAVQRGVRSRFYDRGRFSPRREQGVHHFHSLLARVLE